MSDPAAAWPDVAAAAGAGAEERVPLGVVVTYSLPTVGVSCAFFLTTIYLIKFATDVLLIAPAIMGALFGLSRVCRPSRQSSRCRS